MKKNYNKCQNYNQPIYILENILKEDKIDELLLKKIKNNICDVDPLYILFTSGSTGVPKGTVVCNRSVIDYATTCCNTFNFDEKTVFGSQTPLYFSMSILDVFSTVCSGATFCIIPKMLFSFPIKLIEYLDKLKINTIYWVPSALSIVANFNTFDYAKPQYLEKVLFAGEVMPNKQLNIWRKALPNCMYANLFGPTEITDTGTYYIVDRNFEDNEKLPIGKQFDNCDCFIINEKNELVNNEDEIGELYFRGSFLGLGYYRNEEKNKEYFVQNPLHNNYPETVYRTGDLVKYNDKHELIYMGRKDFQIKHMGYRIELGEIENNISAIEGILSCACIYNEKESKIVLFYQSNNLDESDIIKIANDKLVSYMRPNIVKKVDKMPINANGKIDRVKLKEMEI